MQIGICYKDLDSLDSDDYSAIGHVKNFIVEICQREKIESFIEKWHYSKNVNGLTSDFCFSLKDTKGRIIGAMMYGKIGMAGVWKKYANFENDIIELKRLCCIDKTPKNTESFFIGKTLRWLKKNTLLKRVVSYADPFYSHVGTIYKATNFIEVGETASGRVIKYKGKRYHDKAIRTKNNGKLKPFAEKINNAIKSGEAVYEQTPSKHIFIYNLR